MTAPPLFIYRLGNRVHRLGLKRTAYLISWLNRWLFAVWVPCSATLGRSVQLGYWGLGVVIHSRTVIGEGSIIAQNVTIGRKDGDDGVPVIGEHVYVGAGAVILGPVHIGDHAVIGANSFVNSDVPAYGVAVGSPAKVIKQRDPASIHKPHEPD